VAGHISCGGVGDASAAFVITALSLVWQGIALSGKGLPETKAYQSCQSKGRELPSGKRPAGGAERV
jgi:hypothetical protein